MGLPFRERFGAATTDWTRPDGAKAGDGVGVGVNGGVPSTWTTCIKSLAPLGVQVGRGRQEGGTPPEAVTRFPW